MTETDVTVFVVDDDASMRESLRRRLSSQTVSSVTP